MPFLNERGSSLIQVMVVAAIMGFLSLGVSRVLVDGFRGQKRITQNNDFDIIRSEINTVLSNRFECRQAFRDFDDSFITVTGDRTIPKIVKTIGTSPVLIIEEGEHAGTGIYIDADGIVLQKRRDTSDNPVPALADFPEAGKTTFWMELIINGTRGDALGGSGITNVRAPFPVALVTDSTTGEITDCLSSDGEVDLLMKSACDNAGGDSTTNSCLFHKSGPFNFNVPKLVEMEVDVTVVGGGGGMGARDHKKWNGYGGAGGGGSFKRIKFTQGEIYKITIGKGGKTNLTGWANSSAGGGGASILRRGDTAILNATGGEGGYNHGKSGSAKGGSGSLGSKSCTGGTGVNAEYYEGHGKAGDCFGGSGGRSGSGGGATKIGGDGASGKCGAGAGAHGEDGADGCLLIEW